MGVDPPDSTIDLPVVIPDNVWPLDQYNICLKSGIHDDYRNMLPKGLVSKADYSFPASCEVESGTTQINIRRNGEVDYSVWFAPPGAISFTEGSDMTRANGDAMSINVPLQSGEYHLFIADSEGQVESESEFLLRVP